MNVTEGWITFASILVRGMLSVQILIVLIRSTGYLRFCRSLQRLGVPAALTAQLLFVFRYIRLLSEETLEMLRARDARGYGRRSYPIGLWAETVGQLLLRTLDRAEHIHNAMLAEDLRGASPPSIPAAAKSGGGAIPSSSPRGAPRCWPRGLSGPPSGWRRSSYKTNFSVMSHHYLRFDDVRYTYPDGHEALRGVSFTLRHGEKAALVGMNGAGKSTLLLHTDGLLLPSSGRVDVGGITVTRKTLPIVRQTVGLVFQDADNQLFMPTVGEDVAFGPANMGLTAEEIEERVTRALRAVGAEALRDSAPAASRRPEKTRRHSDGAGDGAVDTGHGRADVEPRPRARRQIIDLLARFDHTMLIATHDIDMIPELCPRTIVLREGRIAADGDTERIFADLPLIEACGLEQPCRMKYARTEAE